MQLFLATNIYGPQLGGGTLRVELRSYLSSGLP